jgi:hypothetical protein
VRLRHALSLPSTLLLSAASWLGSWLGSWPTSRGRQVAVLRLHAAVCWPRNEYTILAEVDERITQLQYLLQLSLRTSENAQNAYFVEFYKGEVLRIPILGTSVNKGDEKGRGAKQVWEDYRGIGEEVHETVRRALGDRSMRAEILAELDEYGVEHRPGRADYGDLVELLLRRWLEEKGMEEGA